MITSPAALVLLTKTRRQDLALVLRRVESLRVVGCRLDHIIVVDDEAMPEARFTLGRHRVELVPASSVFRRR